MEEIKLVMLKITSLIIRAASYQLTILNGQPSVFIVKTRVL
jgi:hypothetical protein